MPLIETTNNKNNDNNKIICDASSSRIGSTIIRHRWSKFLLPLAVILAISLYYYNFNMLIKGGGGGGGSLKTSTRNNETTTTTTLFKGTGGGNKKKEEEEQQQNHLLHQVHNEEEEVVGQTNDETTEEEEEAEADDDDDDDDDIMDVVDKKSTTSASSPALKEEKEEQQQKQEADEQQQQESTKLNIVLFYADDWTMKVIGKLNKYVITPNIDNMASNGIMFTQNCVTTSVCWMSRATLATGLYSSRHQQNKLKSKNMYELHPWNLTLWPLMRNVGNYYTGLVGKWHNYPYTQYLNDAFHYYKLYHGKHYVERDGIKYHVTKLNEIDAIDFLRTRPTKKKNNQQQQPFFLTVSFFATHAEDNSKISYKPQQISMDMLYTNSTTRIPFPKTATDQHWKSLPKFLQSEQNEGRIRWHNRFDPIHYQENIKNLYRMANEVDTTIGNIVKELQIQGVYNNTMLIFTTDNGNLHGEHGLAEKWYPFEESINVPLIIQDPRMMLLSSQVGTINDIDFTLNVDLAPTILGAANIKPSSFMQGRDISDLYLHNHHHNNNNDVDDHPSPSSSSSVSQKPWRTDFFYEYNQGDPITAKDHPHGPKRPIIDASFALITKEWKYVVWPQHNNLEQLFHRSIDKYDEWDTLTSGADHKMNNMSSRVVMVKTTDEIYIQMKERYNILKKLAQDGNKI